jgi:hypothetical protein
MYKWEGEGRTNRGVFAKVNALQSRQYPLVVHTEVFRFVRRSSYSIGDTHTRVKMFESANENTSSPSI